MKSSRKVKNRILSPKVIILFGPPGAGKGTQAELLAKKENLYYLEASKIIEDNLVDIKKGDYVKVEGNKYYLAKEKRLWETGILCSPPFVTFLVRNKIKELARERKGIVMAGSPRTLYEGKNQIPLLKILYGEKNIKIVLIEISPEETIWRNSHRRICELMRHPILYNKETARLKKCPLDGSELVRRKGLDDPKTIKVRLVEYKERTLPLVKYFRKEGLRVKKVNGEQSVGGVYMVIRKSLK